MWQRGWQSDPRQQRPDTTAPARFALGLAFGVAVLVALRFSSGAGMIGLSPLLFMAVVGIAVGRLIGAALGASRSLPLPADPRAIHEKSALRAASRHDGYVTPAELVLESRGLSISGAKILLDQLAAEGWCEVEADDEGRLSYHFQVGGQRTSADDLSAEEWVEAAAQRMRGAGDEDPESVRRVR